MTGAGASRHDPAGDDAALERSVRAARAGDREALEAVVGAVEHQVYNLAIRILWHPQDAEDATQEILVRMITRLSSFRGESSFRTWVYRLASNHLLNTRRRRMEQAMMTFERFGEELDRGLSDAPLPGYTDPEHRLLEEEVKIGCTHAMLLCLDREHRLAYILGEVFQVTGEEGAYIMDSGGPAYRKRLSRARERVRAFMQRRCGLVNPDNPCRCRRRTRRAVELGRVSPENLLFAGRAVTSGKDPRIAGAVEEMDALHRAAAIFRDHPSYAAPERVAHAVMRVLNSGRYPTLVGNDAEP